MFQHRISLNLEHLHEDVSYMHSRGYMPRWCRVVELNSCSQTKSKSKPSAFYWEPLHNTPAYFSILVVSSCYGHTGASTSVFGEVFTSIICGLYLSTTEMWTRGRERKRGGEILRLSNTAWARRLPRWNAAALTLETLPLQHTSIKNVYLISFKIIRQ